MEPHGGEIVGVLPAWLPTRTRHLAEALAAGFLVHDAEGHPVAANRRALHLVGMSWEQVRSLDSRPWSALGRDGRPMSAGDHPTEQARRTRRPLRGVMMGIEHEDATVWLRVDAEPILARDRLMGVQTTLLDVTDHDLGRAVEGGMVDNVSTMLERSSEMISRHSPTGECLWVSPSSRTILGLEPEELIGRDIYELAHPDDTTRMAADHRVLVSGRARRGAYRLRHASGSWIWVELDAWPVMVGGRVTEIQSAGRDVTAAKRREQVLGQLFEAAPVAKAVIDRTGTIRDVNAAFAALAGRDRADLLGRRYADLLDPADREPSAACLEGVFAREPAQGGQEQRFRRPNGRTVWVRCHLGGLLDVDGAAVLAVLQAVDVDAEMAARRAVTDAMAELSYRASHDALTGLLNRRELVDRLARRDPATPIAVMYADLDRLKAINDALGHAAGDRLLIEVAARLRAGCRPEDVVARAGGDEFVVCASVADEAGALELAERIRTSIRDLAVPYGRGITLRTSMSIGVALSYPGRSLERLLMEADGALQAAKHGGRDRVMVAPDRMWGEDVAPADVTERLVEALQSDRVECWVQPMVDMRTGQPLGLEALARLRTHTGTLIPAAHFIPVAAKSDMIGPIGAVMLADALAHMATCPDSWCLTINAAAQELASHDYADLVLGALRGAGLPASRLLLDVAEGTMERLAPHGRQTLERLAAAGVGLVIDDFGTGPSSLSRLNDPLLRGLKVDGSLVAGVGTPGVDRLVRGLVGVADAFDLTVIAEGVEHAEQVDRLLALGVTSGQGHHLGAPTRCGRPLQSPDSESAASTIRPAPSR